MPQFFSYPYNYNELSNYVKDSATENAAKVSDNNHDSFVEVDDATMIEFTFSNKPDADNPKQADAIFILAENIGSVSGGGLSGLDDLEPPLGAKQDIYRKIDTPRTIDSNTPLELTFTKDSFAVGKAKVYEVFLLKTDIELTYNDPIGGSGQSSFSEVQLVQTQEGVGIHEDIYGHRTEYRQYGYRPKYQITYTAPLQTLEEVRSLQRFRENNLNFTFAQDRETYLSRIFPCHFSDFSLPISYTLPHIAQAERYTVKFTIQEN